MLPSVLVLGEPLLELLQFLLPVLLLGVGGVTFFLPTCSNSVDTGAVLLRPSTSVAWDVKGAGFRIAVIVGLLTVRAPLTLRFFLGLDRNATVDITAVVARPFSA